LFIFSVPHPEIIIPPQNTTTLPNQFFNFNCLALSLGLLTYDWKKHDGNLPLTAVKSYIHKTFINSHGGGTTVATIWQFIMFNCQMKDGIVVWLLMRLEVQ